ncbi:MAG: right-handed parallel beta-helix repeat-containing protein, partial [Candidatus Thermoplasmatota archaeon]|nr:right-handed parallel beta-helix repeat-containing protein [Candidatus Thermoplasmatota archaeon]
DSTFTENVCSNNSIGIMVEAGEGNLLIRNNTCNGNSGIGIKYESFWLTSHIENNTCNDNLFGISVRGNTVTSNNTCESNEVGIQYNNTVEIGTHMIKGNKCSNNSITGIRATYFCSVINNTLISNGDSGIEVMYSFNTISRNHIYNHTGYGISITDTMNQISKNLIENNWDGIHLRDSFFNTIINNTFRNDRNNSILDLNGELNHFTNNTIHSIDQTGIRSIESSNTRIEGNHILGRNGPAVIIDQCTHVSIEDNYLYNLFSNGNLMKITNSAIVEVLNNTLNGGNEVSIEDSMVVHLDRNNFTGTELTLSRSPITACRNSFLSCGVKINASSSSDPWIENLQINTTNTVMGKPVRLIQGGRELVFNGLSTGQFIIWNSEKILIENTNLFETYAGIQIFTSSNISINGSVIQDCKVGIKALGSKYIYINGTVIDHCGSSGIDIRNGEHGQITNSLIKYTRSGIDTGEAGIILEDVFDMDIHGNTIFSTLGNSEGLGMSLYSCYGNRIWDNYLFYNAGTGETPLEMVKQVWDVFGSNEWTSPQGRGNYFRDSREPDDDGDGIVDTPYLVGGTGAVMIYDSGPLATCPVVAPPTDLQATPGGNFIYLNWTEPVQTDLTEIVVYNIYKGLNGTEPVFLESIDDRITNYFDLDVDRNDTYFYYVTAVNDLIESDPSEHVMSGVDDEAPFLNITSPWNNSFIPSKKVNITWEMNDSQSGIMKVEISMDMGLFTNIGQNSTFSFTNLTEGKHVATVKVWDRSLRWNLESVGFTVDTVPMELNLTSPGEGAILTGGNVIASWTYFDGTSGPDRFELRSTNGSLIYSGRNSSFDLEGVPNGHHTITLTGYDRAGNPTSRNRSFVMDSTLPDLVLLSPEDGLLTQSTNIRVEWTGGDDGSGIFGYYFKLNGLEWESLGSSRFEKTLWQLNDGVYIIKVKAVDNAGNTRMVSSVIIVDGTRPLLEIRSPTDGSYLCDVPVSIVWNGTDATSGLDHYEISLDGISWTFLGRNISYTIVNLKQGSYIASIKMYDRAGNTITMSTGFVLDETLPEALIWGPEGENINVDTTVSVTFSERMDRRISQFKVSDTDGRVTWKGDRAIFIPNSDLSFGKEYNVTIVAWDLAGNRMRTLEWTFRTDDTGSISGFIMNKKDDPVENTVVTLDDGRSTRSREDGYFFLEAHGGGGKMTIEADGYETVEIDILIIPGENQLIDRIVLSDREGPPVDWTTVLIIVSALILSLGTITVIGIRFKTGKEEGFEE